MLDDGSPTSTNLGNDHGFINKEYSLGLRHGSPTSTNLGNDHGFINKEYSLGLRPFGDIGNDHGFIKKEYSLGLRPFGEAQSKAMRAYAQSGQYRTIVKSRVRLTNSTCYFFLFFFCLTKHFFIVSTQPTRK